MLILVDEFNGTSANRGKKRPNLRSSRGEQKTTESMDDEEEDPDREYKVEKVLEKREKPGGRVEYYVSLNFYSIEILVNLILHSRCYTIIYIF